MGREEPVEFADVECTAESEKAILCKFPDREEPLWIPKSQIDDDSEVYENDGSGKLIISHWIAKEKGLI